MTETTARQIALYLYLQEQNGERPEWIRPAGITFQKIANVTGQPHRSNIKREIEAVNDARALVQEYLEALRKL